MNPVPDLSLVPPELLLQELKRRYDAMIWVAWRDVSEREDQTLIDTQGGFVQALGLVSWAEVHIKQALHRSFDQD